MANNNNNQPARRYEQQFAGIFATVFNAKKAFAGALQEIQITTGVRDNEKAFTVKTNATPVTFNSYDTDANTAFGTGTANSSRFGQRVEVIYQDEDVLYNDNFAIHEGIDRYTVNNDLDAAVADRLDLQSQAKVRRMNTKNGAFISANAGKTDALASLTDADITALFNRMSEYYTDAEVDVPVTAYVVPTVYNSIVDLGTLTTEKNSSVDLDSNVILEYKGFRIEKTATAYFQSGEGLYFAPDGLIIPFTGIVTARTIEADDFDGVALQAAAKTGQFILDDNKVAIAKVTIPAA